MGDFYNGGLWGKYLSFVGLSWNFVPGYIKNVDTYHESFSSKKTSNKIVIAKKSLTNLNKMDSRLLLEPRQKIHVQDQEYAFIMRFNQK